MSSKFEQGRERGQLAANLVDTSSFVASMHQAMAKAKQLHVTAANLDFDKEILAFDAERLASQPESGLFPELKGHIDLLKGEREGFRQATGLDETATAYHFSWAFYASRRLSARHLARYDKLPPPFQCTNVFMPQGVEGVTISDNRDDVPCPEYQESVPKHRPEWALQQDPINWVQGGVSASVLLDDEPACLFPANPFEYGLLPDECLDNVNDIMAFMERYKDFWGPGNQIWVDRHLNAVAVEKTNCLVAFRKPTVNGAIAVTACAYLDDRLFDHQLSRARQAADIKGDTEDESPDMQYHLGSRERYRRLVELTDAEAKRGATLWGALAVVADTAVPFPARICLAGENPFPDKLPVANWSLTQHAAVISGSKRRCLYRAVQNMRNPRPICEEPLKLMLGAGVAMQPEWQADIDAGHCVPAPDALEAPA